MNKERLKKIIPSQRPLFKTNALLTTAHLEYFKPIETDKQLANSLGLITETITVNPLTSVVEVTGKAVFTYLPNRTGYRRHIRLWKTRNDTNAVFRLWSTEYDHLSYIHENHTLGNNHHLLIGIELGGLKTGLSTADADIFFTLKPEMYGDLMDGSVSYYTERGLTFFDPEVPDDESTSTMYCDNFTNEPIHTGNSSYYFNNSRLKRLTDESPSLHSQDAILYTSHRLGQFYIHSTIDTRDKSFVIHIPEGRIVPLQYRYTFKVPDDIDVISYYEMLVSGEGYKEKQHTRLDELVNALPNYTERLYTSNLMNDLESNGLLLSKLENPFGYDISELGISTKDRIIPVTTANINEIRNTPWLVYRRNGSSEWRYYWKDYFEQNSKYNIDDNIYNIANKLLVIKRSPKSNILDIDNLGRQTYTVTRHAIFKREKQGWNNMIMGDDWFLFNPTHLTRLSDNNDDRVKLGWWPILPPPDRNNQRYRNIIQYFETDNAQIQRNLLNKVSSNINPYRQLDPVPYKRWTLDLQSPKEYPGFAYRYPVNSYSYYATNENTFPLVYNVARAYSKKGGTSIGLNLPETAALWSYYIHEMYLGNLQEARFTQMSTAEDYVYAVFNDNYPRHANRLWETITHQKRRLITKTKEEWDRFLRGEEASYSKAYRFFILVNLCYRVDLQLKVISSYHSEDFNGKTSPIFTRWNCNWVGDTTPSNLTAAQKEAWRLAVSLPEYDNPLELNAETRERLIEFYFSLKWYYSSGYDYSRLGNLYRYNMNDYPNETVKYPDHDELANYISGLKNITFTFWLPEYLNNGQPYKFTYTVTDLGIGV